MIHYLETAFVNPLHAIITQLPYHSSSEALKQLHPGVSLMILVGCE